MDLYRAMTPERRAALAADTSVVIRRVAREGIRARHPEYSEAEVSETLMKLLYGKDFPPLSERNAG